MTRMTRFSCPVTGLTVVGLLYYHANLRAVTKPQGTFLRFTEDDDEVGGGSDGDVEMGVLFSK